MFCIQARGRKTAQYSNLRLDSEVWHDEGLTRANSCLEILANSKAKAALVRSLPISVVYSYHIEELSIQSMCKAFRVMIHLQHLDLLLSPKVHLADTFQHIFRECTFSLVTLTVNLEWIMAFILPKMQSIQVTAAYVDSEARNMRRDFLNVFQDLPESSKSKFFCLGICFDEQNDIGDLDTAFAFPAYLPSHSSWSPEPIVDFLRKKFIPTSEIGTFHVHLRPLANEPILRHIIQTISYHFQDV